jgi:4-hydroxybenzoate polyprenyltransferase
MPARTDVSSITATSRATAGNDAVIAPGPGTIPTPADLTRTLRLCFEEARPCVQVMFVVRFATAALLAVVAGAAQVRFSTALALVSWVLATLYTYVINGVADVDEDVTNGLGRPISRGELSATTAGEVARACAAAALLTAGLAGPVLLCLTAAYLALGHAYSVTPFRLNRTPLGAPAVVIAGGVLTFIDGETAVGARLLVPVMVLGVALSLWMGLVGAVVKDLSDVRGDRLAGRRTLVTLLPERALRRSIAAVAPALGLAMTAAALRWAPELVPAGLVLVAGGTAVAVTTLRTRVVHDRARARLPYRTFMVTQYLVHLAVLPGLLLLLP